jgi:uncharacterized protein with GYD domain
MAIYVMLGNFTDQGIKNIKDTTKRADAFRALCEQAGVTVKEVLWCLGQYDLIAIVEADDEETVTALMLSVASLGSVRTELLRAFESDDMQRILAKMT